MAPLWAFQASCVEALLARAGVGPASGSQVFGQTRSRDDPSQAGCAAAAVAAANGGCVGGCGFVRHPNPPAHFKAADRAFCCALCRTSGGKDHGGHCPGKGNRLPTTGVGKGGKGKGDTTNGRGRQSAPKAFGLNDHGEGLAAGADLPEGHCAKLDDEGMVYALLAPTVSTATRRARSDPDDDNESDGGGDDNHAEGSDDGASGAKKGVYFCDRFRRYRFTCGGGGLALLRGLVATNKTLLARNEQCFAGLAAPEVARLRQQGYALYEEKPTLQKGHGGGGASNSHGGGASSLLRSGWARPLGTWSDAEYALPGFQWMYLRLKSFQRFAETWALLERCAAGGLFLPGAALHTGSSNAVKVVSLGGGPGFELLAADWFLRLEAAVPSWTWQPDGKPDGHPDGQPDGAGSKGSGGDGGSSRSAGQWAPRAALELSAARASWLEAWLSRRVDAQDGPLDAPNASFSSLDLQVRDWLGSRRGEGRSSLARLLCCAAALEYSFSWYGLSL
jgi:hypothetical protein